MENNENNNNQLVEHIKQQIADFYSKKQTIHFAVPKGNKKIESTEVRITGIYKYFFCVQTMYKRFNENYTFKYVDVFIKNVIIEEIAL